MNRRQSLPLLLHDNPLLLPALLAAAGLGVAGTYGIGATGSGAGTALLLLAAAALVLGVQPRRRLRRAGRFAALVFVFLGSGWYYNYRQSLIAPPQWERLPGSYTGVVGSVPRETAKVWLADVSVGERKVRAALMKNTEAPQNSAEAPRDDTEAPRISAEAPRLGDTLLLHGTVSEPTSGGNPYEFDYAAYLRRQGYAGTALYFPAHWRVFRHGASASPFLRLRQKLTDAYRAHFGGRDLEVLAAMTLGEKALLSSSTRSLYAETGAAHILALSGLHVGILFGLYNLLVVRRTRSRLTRGGAVAGGLCRLWLFALLAGMPTSLLRATLMYSLMQMAVLLRRDVFSLNNAALAALVVMAVSPQAVLDVGFQLSFAAVASIILLLPVLPRLRSRSLLLRGVYGLVATSLCAQVGTAPLVAWHFHTFPVYALAAALIVVPLAYPILLLAAVFLILPFARTGLATVLNLLLDALHGGLGTLAALPCATLRVYPSALTVALAFATMLALREWWLRRSVWLRRTAMAVTAACILSATTDAHRRLQPQVVVYNVSRCPNLHFVVNETRSYLWSPAPQARQDSALTRVKTDFWQRYGLPTPTPLTAPLRNSDLAYSGHAVAFGGLRFGLLDKAVRLRPKQPLEVDYLIVAPGYWQGVDAALQLYAPQHLVLDASLSERQCRKLQREAAEWNIPVHDIRRDGALRIILPEEQGKKASKHFAV